GDSLLPIYTIKDDAGPTIIDLKTADELPGFSEGNFMTDAEFDATFSETSRLVIDSFDANGTTYRRGQSTAFAAETPNIVPSAKHFPTFPTQPMVQAGFRSLQSMMPSLGYRKALQTTRSKGQPNEMVLHTMQTCPSAIA
ncbi:MAG: hypothetical protein LQ341_007316, partial [Variospora aurantia]